jgi:2-polyprenyl-3-methyl-5-hydroxy-6-metoxy-1,4-benzoquinol methylase
MSDAANNLAGLPLQPEPEVVNEFYSRFWNSEAWGSAQPNEDEQLRAESIIRFIEEFVRPRIAEGPSLRILDLGCGRGWLTSILSDYGSVLGIDPVPAAIERARVLFPDVDVRLSESANLISEGLEAQFDLIVSSEVIEHVVGGQKEAFLRDIYRLLKPGGFAILTTPRGELWKLWNRTEQEEQPVEEWISEKELGRLCEAVRFRVVAKDRVFVRYSLDWLSRIAARNTKLAYIGLQEKLRYHRAIYQVVLLRRDLS